MSLKLIALAIAIVAVSAECTDGYFADAGAGGTCTPCLAGCATCSDGTACLTCSLHSYRVGTPVGTPALCPCYDGFYDDDDTCVPCDAALNCKTCDSATNCLSCFCAQHRTYDTGTCPCDEGYTDGSGPYCTPVPIPL